MRVRGLTGARRLEAGCVWLYRLNQRLGPVIGAYWRLGLAGRTDAIPREGPLLLCSNHASYLDPWFIGMAFPRPVHYLITPAWYNRSPAWRSLFRAFGVEPIRADDAEATIASVCALLARGHVVGIFPEGRISRDGRIQRFRPGFTRTAARSGAPVIPVGIRGSFESLPRHRRFPRPNRVTVYLGEPCRFPGSPMAGPPTGEASRAFRKAMREAICRLSGQPAPVDLEADSIA